MIICQQKTAATKRAVTLRRIKRMKGRIIKFRDYLNELITEIEFFEKSVYLCHINNKYNKHITLNVKKGVIHVHKETTKSSNRSNN